MSMPRETKVDCGGCGAPQPFVAWESLNVTLDKEQKGRLLSGELTRFKCPKCGWSGHVLYPLLYHDMEKRLMVWLCPGETNPDTGALPTEKLMGDYHFRLVRTKNELIEKVLTFDAGLDDRVVEFFKLMLLARSDEAGHALVGELLLGGCSTDENKQEVVRFEHLHEGGAEELAAPQSALSEVARLLAEVLPSEASEKGKWLAVDKYYAQALLEKLNR